MDQITPTIARETALFDYGAMDQATADDARAMVARVRQRSKSYYMDTGRELTSMKDRLDHGLFLRWVEAEMRMTPRTAQNMMQAAAEFGDKSETVSHLPAAVLYKLAAPSTPEPVRAAVLSRIEAGETVQPSEILEQVRVARDAVRKSAAASKEETRRGRLTEEQRDREDALASRGARRKAAEDQRLAKLHADRKREREETEARSTKAAQVLLGALGADALVALVTQYGPAAYEAVRRAEELAHIERALGQPETKLRAGDVFVIGASYGFGARDEQERYKAIARDIEEHGLQEPLVVRLRPEAGQHKPYKVIQGEAAFIALAQVLGWAEIPVHIAPAHETAP